MLFDPRIYRAALAPAVLALVVAAFSLQDPPQGATTSLAPDAFDGERASRTLRSLAREFPDRAPGSRGDRALAGRVERDLRSSRFRTHTREDEGRTLSGATRLRTVVGVRPGLRNNRVVVLAHRDSVHRPGTAELTSTAALLEVARASEGRRLRKTLVLVSTSGGSGGGAGAAAWAERPGRPVDAVLVLGDVGGRRTRKPAVIPWSNDLGVAPVALRSTVEEAVRAETGRSPGRPGALTQFVRLALPATSGEQGALLERGLPAVLLQLSGEPGPDGARSVSPRRLEEHGRAALRSVTAVDSPRFDAQGPGADILLRRRLVPGWAIRLAVGMLLLPVALVALDGFARARRRREPIAMWLVWVISAALPFVAAALLALVLRVTGLLDAAPPAISPPGAVARDGPRIASMLSVLLVLVVGWAGLRPLALRVLGVRGDPGSPGAAAALVLVMTAAAISTWVINPFAAALLLPALHAWMPLLSPELQIRRGAVAALLALGLVVPVAALLWVVASLGLGMEDWPFSLLEAVAGGYAGPLVVLLWSLALGCLVCLLAAVRARGRTVPLPPERRSTRGPLGYAGPGSLGGTDSALRR